MAYRDVLVVADDTPECTQRMQFAARLAARHEAHLIGMMLSVRPDLRRAHGGIRGSRPTRNGGGRQRMRRTCASARNSNSRRGRPGWSRSSGYSAEGEPVRDGCPCSVGMRDIAVIGQSVDRPGALGTVRDLRRARGPRERAAGRHGSAVGRTCGARASGVMVAWGRGTARRRGAVAELAPCPAARGTGS